MSSCELIPLIGGQATTDRRLDRIVEVDERNNDYPVTALLGSTAGGRVESKTWPVPALLDQRRDGACVGFSFTHELVAEPAAWDFTPGRWRWPWVDPAVWGGERFARSVYWQAQRTDPWPGGEYPGAEPRMAGTSLLAGVKVLTRLGYFREYRWAFTVDDTIRAISELGPVVLGCAWFEGMFDVDREAFIRVAGRPAGGHAVCVSGVNVEAEYVTVTNSWGRRWGRDGRGRLSFDDLERLLGWDGEVCVPVVRATPSL